MTEHVAQLAGAGAENTVVAELAKQASGITRVEVEGAPAGLVVVDRPADRRVEVLDLAEHLTAPRAKTGRVAVSDPGSLARYVTAHADEGSTIWADADAGRLVAVIDDHSSFGPGWGRHRATLTLLPTPEWAHWARLDGKLVSQAQFAEHLEDGLPAVTSPPAADLVEACRTLHVQRGVTFTSADRPTTGEVRFAYQEEDTTRAGKRGDVELPEWFTLRLAVFCGSAEVDLSARLRYRLEDGALRLGYKLDRPHEARTAAFTAVVDGLAETTGIRPYHGTPR